MEWFKLTVDKIVDHFIAYSDKFLLAVMTLLFSGLVVYLKHHQADAELLSWGRELTTMAMGGLLGLITGYRRSTEPKDK